MSQSQDRRLPFDILIAIADQLRRHRDILALGLTCNDLYSFLVKKQRRSLEIAFDGSQISCTTAGAPTYSLLDQQAMILTVSCLKINACSEHCYQHGCSKNWVGKCEVLARKLDSAKHQYSRNGCELAKGIKELTLSGYFPLSCYRQGSSHNSMISHPFILSRGFKTMRPETFRVDMYWDSWNFDVLERMSVTNLKVLKLPVAHPTDCVALGRALTNMPRLVSLTITDIPDREEFLAKLDCIGKGIFSCASTLRELDIEMTNFNHLPLWSRDERFIERADYGFFFGKLFLCPQKEELLALRARRYRHDTDPVVNPRLHLTKLRLKHLSLPWYSFGLIFDTTTIKSLHLPYSMVDDDLWSFAGHAKLDTLTEISYNMLSTKFLQFLGQQSSLKELTFARPQDRYHETHTTFYGIAPHMSFGVSAEVPRLYFGYPSLNEFSSSLENTTVLKHLVMPADMYTMTCRSLIFIAVSLTSLEHLELGFDYDDFELQQVFASSFLCGTTSLKKITFLSIKQAFPVRDFDSAHFHAVVESLSNKVSANLKLLRYMPLNGTDWLLPGHLEVYYHRETPVEGEWWMRLEDDEGKQVFAEGSTPRIVPVGKWDWETAAG